MQSLVTVGSAKILQANFDAFKFPTSQLVQFRALVTPCMPRCDPVRCQDRGTGFSSFGRKKRDVPEEEMGDDSLHTKNKSDHMSVVVANAVHIVDSFQSQGAGDDPADRTVLASCLYDSGHILALCGVLAVFTVCQCVLLAVCGRARVGSLASGGRDRQGEHSAVFGYAVNTDKVNTLG